MLFHPPISVRQRSKQQGFTLIELLVVIAIILVLAGITFGISRGVQNAQARARVKADLAAISQALEQFKSVYGAYPITDKVGNADGNNQRLVLALRGELVFTDWNGNLDGEAKTMQPRINYDEYAKSASSGRLFIQEEALSATVVVDGVEQFQDPWGNPYLYDYALGNGSWDNFGYILYSSGPDGAFEAVEDDGVLTATIREKASNIDNIYSGE